MRVVLEADTGSNPDSFLDISDLYGVKPFEAYVSESEAIGMGPIVLRKLSWRSPSYGSCRAGTHVHS